MKLVQCKKKHYYDADKFASCPHCAVYDKKPQDTDSRPMESEGIDDVAVTLEQGLANSVKEAMKRQKG